MERLKRFLLLVVIMFVVLSIGWRNQSWEFHGVYLAALVTLAFVGFYVLATPATTWDEPKLTRKISKRNCVLSLSGIFESRRIHVHGLVLAVIPDAVIGTHLDYIAGASRRGLVGGEYGPVTINSTIRTSCVLC
jgi:hypothetical protein